MLNDFGNSTVSRSNISFPLLVRMVGWTLLLQIRLHSMSRTFELIFDFWFRSSSEIFLTITVFVLFSWFWTLSNWLLVLLCYVVLSRLILVLLYFRFSLFSVFTPRPRVGGFSTRRRAFLSSPVFHRPFMVGRIIFFCFFFISLGLSFILERSENRPQWE